jgi:hypothetical protein
MIKTAITAPEKRIRIAQLSSDDAILSSVQPRRFFRFFLS